MYNPWNTIPTPEALYNKLQSDFRNLNYCLTNLTKQINKLERKQEKLKNFIKELKND